MRKDGFSLIFFSSLFFIISFLYTSCDGAKNQMNNASSLFTGKGMTCIEVAEVLAYESSEPITYEGVLKPLIFEPICASCHSPSGTMSTRNWLDYSTAQQHARNIASKVWGEMPPQGAEVRQLTTAEKELLQKWVEAGTPRGTGPIPAVLNCEK